MPRRTFAMQSSLLNLFKIGVNSVDPTILIKSNVKIDKISGEVQICDQVFKDNENMHVLGFGKAVHKMAICLNDILKARIKSGVLSIPHINETLNISPIRVMKGACDNLPDEDSLAATDEIIKLAQSIPEDDVVVVLISGGGSSLLTKPVEEITLNDKLLAIKMLVSAGANINELNTVRKCLSQVKGGGLAKFLKNKRTICLILSDVIGNPLDIIASGPLFQNVDGKEAGLDVIRKYKLELKIPKNVLGVIKNSTINLDFNSDNIINKIIGSNEIALKAIQEINEPGFHKILLTSKVEGLVQHVSEAYLQLTKYIIEYMATRDGSLFQNLRNWARKYSWLQVESHFLVNIAVACESEDINKLFILVSGETTVKVNGCGKGGRNQELAVLFSDGLYKMKDDLKNFDVNILCGGTDGIDGPTDAAGAIGSTQLIEQGLTMGLQVDKYLENNDTYSYLSTIANGENLIKIGHTGTNVMDIHIIAISKPQAALSKLIT